MKTFNLTCSQSKDIVSFIQKHQIHLYSTVFVQMYSGIVDKKIIQAMITDINNILPSAQLVGATTDGEICNGKVTTNQVAISFLVFEKTLIKPLYVSLEKDQSLEVIGKNITERLLTDKTKLLLVLGNGLHFDYESLVEGLTKASRDTFVFGAFAGANGDLGETFVWLNNQVTNAGLIAIAFESDDLLVHPFTSNGWKEIGSSFTITKAEGNIIHEINHQSPLNVITKYLGDNFVQELPQSGAQFPLMTYRNEKKTPMFAIRILDNGFLKVDKQVIEGETFTFSYADFQGVMASAKENIEKLQTKPVESILIFNCMARRRYFYHFVDKEIEALQKIAPTCGFFSYGEIDNPTKGIVEYVSCASIVLGLSEKNEVINLPSIKIDYNISDESKATVALSHLINASTQDIVKLNKNLESSEQKYKSLFEHNSDIVFSIDLSGRFLSINPRFTEVFGFSEKQILNKSAVDFLKPKDVERVTSHFYQTLHGKEQTYELELMKRDGQERTYLIKHIPIIIDRELAGVYAIGRDITAQKKAEERVAYLAYFDPETALPNRQNFSEKLSEEISVITKRKNKAKIAILFIDFDRFKIINDSLGHYVGDKLLKSIIDRIRVILPTNSYLGRFGGDKFILSLTDFQNTDEVINIAQALLTTINKPILYNDKEFYVTASMGVSLYPEDGVNADSLLKNADAAMNQAKKSGGNRIKFYSNDMNNQALFRVELESYLRKALEKNEFFLCYQPFIDIKTDAVIGAEALIRWDHPKLGLVSPAEFIPLAEETGLITDIGVWVLHTACQDAKKWQEKGLGNLTISVNVSAYQFQQPTFIDEVKKALDTSRLAPCYLQLELTESVMLRNATYSIAVMQELQDLGVQLSVDDFGTGYSSLSYLRDLPINNLKIDRSFIKNLRFDTKDVAIVNAIVTMGKGLNLKVIAEGIETEEQLQLLHKLSCDVAQGYYLSKPLEVDSFVNFIEKRFPSFF